MRHLGWAAFASVVTLSSGAWGQASTAPAAAVASPAPAPAHAPTAARLAINRGAVDLLAHNFDGALAAFREAQAGQGERAEATLDVGYTLNARGDHDGALSAFREAMQYVAVGAGDLDRVRALQAIANTFEVMQRWSDAATAWEAFISFAEAHPTLATAANGRARLEAFHARDALEQRYAPVRERIEARRRANASNPPPSP